MDNTVNLKDKLNDFLKNTFLTRRRREHMKRLINKPGVCSKTIAMVIAMAIFFTSFSFYLLRDRNSYANVIGSNTSFALEALKPNISNKSYNLPVLKGLEINTANPLALSFYVDTMNKSSTNVKEVTRLINYFLGFLAVPESKLWVNLSPYEGDRIIPKVLCDLDIGRDLLVEDYLLKRITATLTDPNTQEGKKFWQEVNKTCYLLTKSTNFPLESFNKVWIMPDKAQVIEYNLIEPTSKKATKTVAFVKQARLKVLMEEDFLALNNNLIPQAAKKNNLKNEINKQAKDIFKRQILPIIENEINIGSNFAPLRQMYHSLILSGYFKRKLKNSSFFKYYIDQEKANPITQDNSQIKTKVYESYVKCFKDGAYKRIRNEYDPFADKKIAKKYLSGGFQGEIDKTLAVTSQNIEANTIPLNEAIKTQGNLQKIGSEMNPQIDGQEVKPTTTDNSAKTKSMFCFGPVFCVSLVLITALKVIKTLTTRSKEEGKIGKFYQKDKIINDLNSKLENIPSPLDNNKKLLQEMFDLTLAIKKETAATNTKKVEELTNKLNNLIDLANAQDALKMLSKLCTADVANLEDFANDQMALDSLEKGELFLQLPFAGAGSRMEESLKKFGLKINTDDCRIANLDGWEIVCLMGNIVYEKAKKEAIKNNKSLADAEKLAQEAVEKAGLKTQIPEFAKMGISLAQRAMLALEQGIMNLEARFLKEGLSSQAAKDKVAKIKNNLKMVIAVSDEIEEKTKSVFISNSPLSGEQFFGLNKENIVFINGGYNCGFEFNEQGKLVASTDPKKQKLSWNHGYAFVEMAWKKGYTLTGNKDSQGNIETKETDQPVFQYIQNRGGLYGCVQRVNDLMLLHPDMALDVQMFGGFLTKAQGKNGIDALFEMMANPTAQKGGLALSIDGSALVLLEGLATKNPQIKDKLDKLTQVIQFNYLLEQLKKEKPILFNKIVNIGKKTFKNSEEFLLAVIDLIENTTSKNYPQLKKRLDKLSLEENNTIVKLVKKTNIKERASAEKKIKELTERLSKETDPKKITDIKNQIKTIQEDYPALPGIPYNRLKGYYRIDGIIKAIEKDPLPLSIKSKNGVYSFEMPTGDITQLPGLKVLACKRKKDIYIEEGILPNELRDTDNETIVDYKGDPVKAYDPTNGGSGAIIHDDKEAKYIKDLLKVLLKLDNPISKFFQEKYYTTKTNPIQTSPLEAKGKTIIKFGTSGWRGQLNDTFVMSNVQRAAQGLAQYCQESGINTILIGFDPRQGNSDFAKETANILAANGINVEIILEPTPTPVLAYYSRSTNKRIGGVVNFTASHNKYTDDGFKFSPWHGGAADDQTLDKITYNVRNIDTCQRFRSYEIAKSLTGKNIGKIIELKVPELVKLYTENYLKKTLVDSKDTTTQGSVWHKILIYFRDNPSFNLQFNPMCGTASLYIQNLAKLLQDGLKTLGVTDPEKRISVINANNDDPYFQKVNGAPNPTEIENIRDWLISLNKKTNTNSQYLGLSVDGDSDRFGLRDVSGESLGACDIMALMIDFLAEKGLIGKIGKTLSTSDFLAAVGQYWKEQGKNIESIADTKVGFKFLVAQVLASTDSPFLLAGEESAHCMPGLFKDSWDDGIAMNLVCLWMVAEKGSLSKYKEEIEKRIGKKYFYKRYNLDLTDQRKATIAKLINDTNYAKNTDGFPIKDLPITQALVANGIAANQIAEVITLDGLKVVFTNGDWFCLRLSGTENIARFYVEATDPTRHQNIYNLGLKLLGLSPTKTEALKTQPLLVDKYPLPNKIHFIDPNINNITEADKLDPIFRRLNKNNQEEYVYEYCLLTYALLEELIFADNNQLVIDDNFKSAFKNKLFDPKLYNTDMTKIALPPNTSDIVDYFVNFLVSKNTIEKTSDKTYKLKIPLRDAQDFANKLIFPKPEQKIIIGNMYPLWLITYGITNYFLNQPSKSLSLTNELKQTIKNFLKQTYSLSYLDTLKGPQGEDIINYAFNYLQEPNVGLIRKVAGSIDTYELISPQAAAIWSRNNIFIEKEIGQCFDSENKLNTDRINGLLKNYSQAINNFPLSLVEARQPFLRAVLDLPNQQKTSLTEHFLSLMLSSDQAILETTALFDVVLLMLKKMDKDQLKKWAEQRFPQLSKRRLYLVAPEITLLKGGLGRVMQYLGRSLKQMGFDVAFVEPRYRNKNVANSSDREALDYAKLSLPVNFGQAAGEFKVKVQGQDVETQYFEAKNDEDIPVYTFWDKEGYFTNLIFVYDDSNNRNDKKSPDPNRHEHTEYATKAMAKLIDIVETKSKAEKKEKWNAPVIHLNDGQALPTAIWPLVLKEFQESGILTKAHWMGTCHTVMNTQSGMSEEFLIKAGIPYDSLGLARRQVDYRSNTSLEYDWTGLGLRAIDRLKGVANCVSNEHAINIAKEFFPGMNIYGVTNGDLISYTMRHFGLKFIESNFSSQQDKNESRKLEEEISKINTAIEEAQKNDKEKLKELSIEKAKKERNRDEVLYKKFWDFVDNSSESTLKELFKALQLACRKDYINKYIIPNLDALGIAQQSQEFWDDFAQKTWVGYSGRWVFEKWGRLRAWTEANIMEMLKEGIVPVILSNVQYYNGTGNTGPGNSLYQANIFTNFVKNLNGKDIGTKAIYKKAFDINEQILQLMCIDCSMQDSEMGVWYKNFFPTGAAESTEAHTFMHAGMMHGFIHAICSPFDLSSQRGANPVPADGKPESYLTLFKMLNTLKRKDKLISHLIDGLRQYRAIDENMSAYGYLELWEKSVKDKEDLAKTNPNLIPSSKKLKGEVYIEKVSAVYNKVSGNYTITLKVNPYGIEDQVFASLKTLAGDLPLTYTGTEQESGLLIFKADITASNFKKVTLVATSGIGREEKELDLSSVLQAHKLEVQNFFKTNRVEVGLHTVTGSKAFANVPTADLVNFSQKIIAKQFVPFIDNLEVLTNLRQDQTTAQAIIGFVIDTQNQAESLLWQALAKKVDIIALGEEVNKETVAAIREMYPQVVIIKTISVDHKTEEEINKAINQTIYRQDSAIKVADQVDGIMFKPYYKNGAVNIKEEIISPLSYIPNFLVIVAGGVFETKVGETFSLANNVISAIGFNQTTTPGFDGQLARYVEAIEKAKDPRIQQIDSNPITQKILTNIENQFQEMANDVLKKASYQVLPELKDRMEKVKNFLAKIAQRLNSDDANIKINPDLANIRVKETDPERTASNNVLRIGVYPIAGNPLHWDHLLVALEAIAQEGLDKVIFDIQSGKDIRKPHLALTETFRYELCKEELNLFAPLFSFSENTSACGEEDIFRILNLNPTQKIDAFYMVGSDHYNRWAQLKDKEGKLLPKEQQPQDSMLKGSLEYEQWKKDHQSKEPSPDTIQRLEENPTKFNMNATMHSVSALFAQRPGEEEKTIQHKLKNLKTLPCVGASSSTAIRKAFEGLQNNNPVEQLSAFAYLPFMGYKYLNEHREYLRLLLITPQQAEDEIKALQDKAAKEKKEQEEVAYTEEFIYHAVARDVWEGYQTKNETEYKPYVGTSINFIHGSADLDTAKKYAPKGDYYILKINTQLARNNGQVEIKGQMKDGKILFPHIHGPLQISAVVEAIPSFTGAPATTPIDTASALTQKISRDAISGNQAESKVSKDQPKVDTAQASQEQSNTLQGFILRNLADIAKNRFNSYLDFAKYIKALVIPDSLLEQEKSIKIFLYLLAAKMPQLVNSEKLYKLLNDLLSDFEINIVRLSKFLKASKNLEKADLAQSGTETFVRFQIISNILDLLSNKQILNSLGINFEFSLTKKELLQAYIDQKVIEDLLTAIKKTTVSLPQFRNFEAKTVEFDEEKAIKQLIAFMLSVPYHMRMAKTEEKSLMGWNFLKTNFPQVFGGINDKDKSKIEPIMNYIKNKMHQTRSILNNTQEDNLLQQYYILNYVNFSQLASTPLTSSMFIWRWVENNKTFPGYGEFAIKQMEEFRNYLASYHPNINVPLANGDKKDISSTDEMFISNKSVSYNATEEEIKAIIDANFAQGSVLVLTEVDLLEGKKSAITATLENTKNDPNYPAIAAYLTQLQKIASNQTAIKTMISNIQNVQKRVLLNKNNPNRRYVILLGQQNTLKALDFLGHVGQQRKAFGRKLRQALEETQALISTIVTVTGISQDKLSAWLNNKWQKNGTDYTPTIKDIKALAAFFAKDYKDFFVPAQESIYLPAAALLYAKEYEMLTQERGLDRLLIHEARDLRFDKHQYVGDEETIIKAYHDFLLTKEEATAKTVEELNGGISYRGLSDLVKIDSLNVNFLPKELIQANEPLPANLVGLPLEKLGGISIQVNYIQTLDKNSFLK